MKAAVTVSIDVEVLKKLRAKNVNISKIVEEAFRNYLNTPKPLLKPAEPIKSLAQTYLGFPKKWRIKAEDKFMLENGGLVPNFERKEHVERLMGIYSGLAKQTKINLKEEKVV